MGSGGPDVCVNLNPGVGGEGTSAAVGGWVPSTEWRVGKMVVTSGGSSY